MIAFHFPPMARSSGIQRTLRFVRHLPEFGWQPTVLSAHERGYVQTSNDLLGDIPPGVKVFRAQVWDTSRHLSFAGHYPGFLARPDGWITWWPGAVLQGMSIIRRERPDAIWSTYPIATAHLIGNSLSRRSGIPWIADFRDPMAQPGYPEDRETWRAFDRIERQAVGQADASVFTTPGAVATYKQRYPSRAERILLLENGYDEDVFAGAEGGEALNPGRLTLLHSGIVYPSERDPTRFFEALAILRRRRPDLLHNLMIRFRAAVHDDLLRELAHRFEVTDEVQILPPVSYRAAVNEMMCADGLLILQGESCNQQVPAKLYEYMRAGRPIIVLADPNGDTARVAKMAGIGAGAPLEDAGGIARLLEDYCENPRLDTLPESQAVASASRRERTRNLVELLEDVMRGSQVK